MLRLLLLLMPAGKTLVPLEGNEHAAYFSGHTSAAAAMHIIPLLLLLLLTGKTLVPLEGNPQIARSNETNLGNYVCEAFLKSVPAAVTAQAGNISICLMVAGGIRTGIEVSKCKHDFSRVSPDLCHYVQGGRTAW
jgi:hypothetical protein